MRRIFVTACLCASLLWPSTAAWADPPDDPNATGQCAAEEGSARKGKPADPSHSYPFECPEPPGFR